MGVISYLQAPAVLRSEKNPCTLLVGQRAGANDSKKMKISFPYPDLNPRQYSVQLVTVPPPILTTDITYLGPLDINAFS